MFGAGLGGKPASRSTREKKSIDDYVVPGGHQFTDVLSVEGATKDVVDDRARRYVRTRLVPDGFEPRRLTVKDAWEQESGGKWFVEIEVTVVREDVGDQ